MFSYPRRRTAIACEICRGRKTRCDGRKPVCGFCEVFRCQYKVFCSRTGTWDRRLCISRSSACTAFQVFSSATVSDLRLEIDVSRVNDRLTRIEALLDARLPSSDTPHAPAEPELHPFLLNKGPKIQDESKLATMQTLADAAAIHNNMPKRYSEMASQPYRLSFLNNKSRTVVVSAVESNAYGPFSQDLS